MANVSHVNNTFRRSNKVSAPLARSSLKTPPSCRGGNFSARFPLRGNRLPCTSVNPPPPSPVRAEAAALELDATFPSTGGPAPPLGPPRPPFRTAEDDGDVPGDDSSSSLAALLLNFARTALSAWATSLLPTSVQCAVVGFAAELTAQLLSGQWEKGLDTVMLRLKFLYGGTFRAVAMSLWYAALGAAFPGAGVAAVASKIALDLAFGNALLASVYLAGIPTLQGAGEDAAVANVRNNLLSLVVMGWKFWLLPTALAQSVVPAPLRTPFLLAAGYVYECVLALTPPANLSESAPESAHVLLADVEMPSFDLFDHAGVVDLPSAVSPAPAPVFARLSRSSSDNVASAPVGRLAQAVAEAVADAADRLAHDVSVAVAMPVDTLSRAVQDVDAAPYDVPGSEAASADAALVADGLAQAVADAIIGAKPMDAVDAIALEVAPHLVAAITGPVRAGHATAAAA